MKTFKRALSVLLATAMILTTFFIFDPSGVLPKAEAAVTATDPAYSNLYFVVPEAIYLAPRYNSYKANTSSSFQWYINNTLEDDGSITLDTGESGTGKIAFRYDTASDVRISFRWQSEPGNDISPSASITFGDGNERTPSSPGYRLALSNGRGSTMIMWGNSPTLDAGTTGVWICWIATYTDTADGLEKQAYAYTYVYKPYVAPIAVGIRGKNTRGSNYYGSYISWISGVHGVAEARDLYPKAKTSQGLLPFSSSASGIECCNLNLTLGSYFQIATENEGPGGWFEGSSAALPDASGHTFSGTTDSHSGGDDYVINFAYSATGKMTIDNSRYHNLNEIPNLSVGLMVTDDEDSDSGAAYFISNFYGHNGDFESDYSDFWATNKDGDRAKYWDALYGSDQIAVMGNWNNMSAPEGEGIKFNERWKRDITSASSGVFYVGTGYGNQQNGDKIYDVSELRCRVDMFDKSALRNAYFYAINSFPANNIVLLGENSQSWLNFISLFRAVSKWLTKLDGTYTATLGYNSAAALANELRRVTDQIKDLSNEDRLNFMATQYNIKVYEENGKWKLSSVNGKTMKTTGDTRYHRGARVAYSAEVPTGYVFAGYFTDVTVPNPEAMTLPGNQTVKQANTVVTDGDYIVENANYALNCTYYFLRKEYTIEYDLDGGALAAGTANPASYNVESNAITLLNPIKTGYTFQGWTGTGLGSMQTSVTIPAGSTGDRSYKAHWGAHSYTVHYDGNGATFGETPDSEHTFGVPKELSPCSFLRAATITYHWNDQDDPDECLVEEIESAGFEFAGWNTEPDGSGTGFAKNQSVVDLTTEDSITLYAQWNPIQDVLTTPEREGYGFAGWYTDPNFAPSSYFGTGGSAFVAETDLELYAKWEEHVYTIHYNGNGATSGATANSLHHIGRWEPLTTNGFRREYTVTFDPQGGTVSPASTKFVYDFKYWTLTENDRRPTYAIDDEVKDLTMTENSLEMYAQWRPQNATVVPPEPEQAGFSFDGWFLDENCTQPVGDTIVPTENMTLYAGWTATAYLIQFDVKGGDAVAPIPYTTKSNDTLPRTSRTGYTFGNWRPTTSEGNWDMDRTYVVGTSVRGKYGSITLEALWTPIDYTITFDMNGGSNYPDATNQKTFNIESAGTIGTPVYHGYTFNDWLVLETSGNWEATGTVLPANTPLAGKYGNVSLSAQWTKASYTITFDTDGGTPINDMNYTIDSLSALPDATKNGYTFVGWKPAESSGIWDADMTYLPEVTKLTGKYGDVTLVAQWSLAGYMLTFDERGGEEVANLYYTTQSTATLGETTRPAYTFAGWKPKATVGSWDMATVYPAGTSLTGKFGAATLVAQWTPIEYTVTFDTNGAGNYPYANDPDCVLTYTTESQIPLGSPEREGFTFLYWVVTATDGNWTAVDTTYKEGAMLTYKYGNVSLRAEWKSNGFLIAYDLGGGRLPQGSSNPTSYTVDNPDFQLINPIWTGYEFTGWTGTDLPDQPGADGNYAIDVTIYQGSMGDREYVAHWSPINYIIQYTYYGGALPNGVTNPARYTVETATFTLHNPVRTGYVFAGWEGTGLERPRVEVDIQQGSTGDRNYRATWTEEVYTLSYDLGGGVLAQGFENPTSFTITSPLITLNNPTREGYTFAGWTSMDMVIADPMRVYITRGSTGSRSFTATWDADGYTITYDLAGGTLPSGSENPDHYNIETPNITLNNPTKEGYDFAGWTGSNGANPQTTVIIVKGSTEDKSYTANWTPVVYTLGYNLDNGQLEVQNPLSYTIESETFTLNNPTKLGYEFAGWKLGNDGEPQTTVTIPRGSIGNRVYRATWTIFTYTITYDLTGGELGENDQGQPITNPTSYTVESDDITLNNPSKTGYSFAGWTGSNGQTPQTTVFIAQNSTTGNKNYTANWTPIVYTITYRQLFPGSTTPIALEMENEETYTVETPPFPLNNPTSETYAFDGWTGSNGTEKQPSVTIVPGTGEGQMIGNLTFVAHWGEATAYNISYFLNGGTEVKANPTKYTVNSLFQLYDPAKLGYTFTGWTGTGLPDTPDDDGNYTIGPIIANQTGDRMYTAHWKANKYYVQFRANGGSGTMSTMEFTYDATTVLLTANAFVRTGSTFLGWSTSENATEPEMGDREPVRNLTTAPFGIVVLYAVWETNPCTILFDGNGATGGNVPEISALFGETIHLWAPEDAAQWPNGYSFFVRNSRPNRVKCTFLGWSPASDSTIIYEPGAEYLCLGDETFNAVWSANYYSIDNLITQIEGYRADDAVPANANDEAYMRNNEYDFLLGSDGSYPWDNYDMSDLEAALADATDPDNRDLPSSLQGRVDNLRNALQRALREITLLPASEDVEIACAGGGFYDEYNDMFYPPCEEGNVHSFRSLQQTMDALFAANNDDILYTAASVQRLHDIVYGNNFDIVGLIAQARNAEYKMPAQGLLDEYTMQMAEAYHQTLELKDASFEEIERLKTEYLPGLHNDVAAGQNVTYDSIDEYYMEDGVIELNAFYDEITNPENYRYNIVEQWRLEDGGDVYMTMRDLIDALVPKDANYGKVFYEILNIPTGTDGFEYPAANATENMLPTWMEWARENAGSISSQMDNDYLSARYTENSLAALYRVLDAINWDLNVFEQDDVDGANNITSYWTLLQSARNALRERKYTITYKYNDGTDASFTTQSDYSYGDRIANFPATNPRRVDYVFRGWSADPDDDTPVSVEDRVYGNITLYAIWTSQFTITYDYNGGEAPATPNPTRYADSDPDITLNNPTKAGYDFAGWTGTNGNVPAITLVIVSGSTGSRHYIANWTPSEYAITYDLTGGELPEGVTNPMYYTIESDPITLNNPTKDGYAFAGWTGANGTEPQTPVTIATGSIGEKHFVANWTASGFTLTYDLKGGVMPEGVTNPTTYTINTETFTLNNPVREGCTFDGWTEVEGDEPQTSVTIVKGSTGDRVFTANWTADLFMIVYDLAEGTLPDGVSNTPFYTVESESFTLNNPTRFGYDFTGWTGTGLEKPTIEVTVAKGSSGERSYTATWTPTEYAISYELNGGTAENPATHTIEDDAITLQAPTKSGFEFNGWTGSNGTTPQTTVTIPAHSTGELNYTANWTIIEYTITYTLDGGTVAQANPTAYTVESAAITLNNPTRRGYRFDGWTGTDLDEAAKTVEIPTGSTGNRSYTANWTIVEYTLDYDLAGGALGDGVTNPDSFTVETETFTLNNPTKANYDFAGWVGTGISRPETEVTIDKGSITSRSYTATWTPTSYSITYDLAGGALGEGVTNPESYTIETETFALKNPSKPGCTFAGWTGSNGTNPESPLLITKGSTGDKNFTANWDLIEYTIGYNLNGGTAENPTTYTVETESFTLTSPTKRGYTFAGWTGTGLEEAAETVTIATGSIGNRNYTATWTPTEYAINYDLDGGDAVNPDSYTIESDDITLTAPTRPGYTFAGWTGSNGSEPVKNVTIASGSVGDKNFKANWTVVEYAITYTLFGGTAENPATYTIETDTFSLNAPTRTGYTFAGWTGSNGSEPVKNVTIEKGSIGERAYTANWTTDEYTITYDLADGELTEGATNPAVYTVESEAITLTNPTKTGYTFAGWTGTDLDAATETVTIPTGSTGNRTYTATWTAVVYTINYDLADGAVAEENPAEYTIESEAITLTNPTKKGYVFAGWTGTGLNEASKAVTIAAGSTGNRSYTATWETIEYPISYELADGVLAEGATNPESYTVESEAITLTNPTKKGYTFAGWTGTGLDEAAETVTIPTGSTGERIYTATWTAVEYAISYELAGGALAEGKSNPASYTIESEAITLNNPAKKGYSFAGWTGTGLDEAAETVTIPTGSTGDRSYTATWTSVDYTITYDLAGGAVAEENPAGYNVESEAITLTNPTKKGYTFAGWTGTDLDAATETVTIPAGSTGNRTYTATWTAVVYTISYELAGGTVAEENPAEYTIESEAITLTNPAKTGYTFAGWTGTDLDEAAETVTIPTGSTGDRSYTATWTSVDYTITYDLAGGAVAEENPAGYTVESEAITLTNPTKKGYTFAGWTGTGLDEAAETVTIPTGSTGNRAYTATWTAVVYTISYELAGGTVAEENPAEYTIESDAITLTNPAKTGYTFAGWTGTGLDEAAETVTIPTGSTGNKSYTATWTAVDYTITYDLDGGAAENPTTYTVETETFALTAPAKNGYTFIGWTGDNGETAQQTVLINKGSTGDKSFTANWTVIEYTIGYNLNGGTAENPTTYTVESDDVTLTNPTKKGYTFAGWTGTGLDEATETVTIPTGSTGNRNYTATWNATEYAIAYELDGGAVAEENPTVYTIESSEITLTNPTKKGYTFAGWTGTGLTQATATVTIPTGSVGERSYTATWTAVDYTITYELDGGTAENPATYTIETETFSLTAPTKDGYAFDGWTGTGLDEAATEVTIEKGSTGDRTYTATWKIVDYTITYDLAGGELAEGATNPAGYSFESEAITLTNPTKTGYDFAGWTGTGLAAAAETVTIPTGSTGDRTYTATWTPTAYTITYDLDGGNATNPASYTVETETFTLQNPTKPGYIFAGWTGDNGDEPQVTVTIEKGTMGNKSFTANWTTDGYTIEYDLAGGTATNPDGYTIESPTFKLNNPTKTGYIFNGWTGTGLDELTIDVIIEKGSSGNRSYTANWTPITYFVEFHSNTAEDGSFTMEYTYDTTYPMPENTFTKTGAAFQGWSATGNGEPLAEIVNLTAENNGRVILLAVWADIEYALTFDLNGATGGTVEDMGVTYSQKVNLPDGADLTLFSDENEESRTFLGWTANGTAYEPGAEFECPDSDVTFTAVWSANYYALDKLVETIEDYQTNDAVPATAKDPQYQAGGEIADALGSNGLYTWDSFDMTDLEAALADAKDAGNRDLPADMQSRVDALKTTLQRALNNIELLDADSDAAINCGSNGEGFYDEHTDKYYPLCEDGEQHSFNSLLALMDAIFAADNADLLYTAESVQALHDIIYGNGFDKVGIKAQAENSAFKKPAQAMLDAYTADMAYAYHATLVLKGADYTALDELITVYLPSLHNDVEAGQNVTYNDLESYYTADSVEELNAYYENIDRTYNIAQQWMIEEGGDVYDGLKDAIDALVPLDADYTNVFYEILNIPTGTEGFTYPAEDVTRPAYPTWIEWARDNEGNISAQMDTEYLNVRYTEASVQALNRVLDDIDWNMNLFQQDDVDGLNNIRSCRALLKSAVDGLKLRKYTVTFKYNDGTDASFTTQSDYSYGDRIASFPATDPQREGFVFKGWSIDPEGTNMATVEDRVTANFELYAIWGSVEDEPLELVAREGSTTVIDNERGFIYGLDFNLTTNDVNARYLEVIGNGHLEYSTVAAGTGTVVTLINDYTGETAATYELVIFGDLDGDGMLGSTDFTQMRAISAQMVELVPGSAKQLAADVTHDGMISSTDYTQIRSAAAQMVTISQTLDD